MPVSFSLYALPGFLGMPADWDGLFPGYSTFKSIELFKSPIRPLWDWARDFNASCKRDSQPKVLLGYSLGARLAMHALLLEPSLWEGAILVSGHVGLNAAEDRRRRKESDQGWAKRFLEEPWDDLMRDWNAQKVFAFGCNAFHRSENDYDRSHLSQAIATWSLGNQEPLKERLEMVQRPILYVAGKEDPPYVEMAHSLRLQDISSEVRVLPHAGHRAPWDQPLAFSHLVAEFLKKKGTS